MTSGGLRLGFCLLLAQVAAVGPGGLLAQDGTAASPSVRPAEVRFHFEREGMPVPRYTIVVPREGNGRYEAEVRPPRSDRTYGSGRDGVAAESVAAERTGEAGAGGGSGSVVVQPMTLQPATVEKIFKAAAALENFRVNCASKAKNIADTGTKTLSYNGPERTGSCTYNFTENKTVRMLTELFGGLALTMDEGRQLAFDHRYDRLGLDAELESLRKAVEEDRAVDVGMIAPVLREIVADTELMQRARERAARLLDSAGVSR